MDNIDIYMEFRFWLEASTYDTWYHATTTEAAKDILTRGWSLSVPRKTDVGDLGWGIYFWKGTALRGTYGNVLIAAQIEMDRIVDLSNENDPRVQHFMKLFFYTPQEDPQKVPHSRTVNPYADIRHRKGQFIDKGIEVLRKKGMEFPDAWQKVTDYVRERPTDDTLREQNAKMIRRNMLKIGVKGSISSGGKELAVYDPSIIKSQELVKPEG